MFCDNNFNNMTFIITRSDRRVYFSCSIVAWLCWIPNIVVAYILKWQLAIDSSNYYFIGICL